MSATGSSTKRNLLVLLYSVLTIASASLQAVSFKKAGYSLAKYPFFILLVVSFAFVPIFFSLVLYIELAAQGFVAEVRTWAYKKHFMVIGLLNGLNGILIIFSNPHVAGVVQSTLSQVVIPVTLSLSVAYLGASFSKMMYAGALIICCGVALELSPSISAALQHHPNSAAAAAGPSSSGFWALVFLLGQVPAALCSIYQEQAFTQGVRVNVVLMMAWSSLAQFIFLVLAVPLDWIPGFGSTTPSGFTDEMHNALRCTLNELEGHPECASARGILLCCIATMLFTNVFQALLVKHSSAALSVLVLTLITPVSTLCFTMTWLMGSEHTEKMSSTQIVALAVLMAGVCVYRYADVTSEERVRAKSMGSRDGSMAMATSSAAVLGTADAINDPSPDIRTGRLRGIGSTGGRGRTNSDPTGSANVSVAARAAETDAAQRAKALGARAPMLLSSRCGIIACEYTADGNRGRKRQISILYEVSQSTFSLFFTF